MHFLKWSSVSLLSLFVLGCSATSDINESDQNGTVFTQAEIDILIERVRAEERSRIQKELGRQAQQKSVFNEILNRQKAQQTFHKTESVVIQQEEKQVHKIIPTSRKPQIYREQEGIVYYRCAANALVAEGDKKAGWKYQPDRKELSATLCKKSRDHKTMLSLQEKLYSQGYLQSDRLTKQQLVDGVWGETTLEAVKKYQLDHGLLFGQMTIETLEHIGVFTPKEASMLGVNSIQPVANIQIDESLEESKSLAEINPSIETIDVTLVEPEKVEPLTDKAKSLEEEVVDELVEHTSVAKTVRMVEKIVPKSRKPQLYQKVGGASYFRCAANALVAQPTSNGKWTYSTQEELSATLCKMSRDQATMTDLQYELYEKGFLRDGETPKDILVDGTWGKPTLEALKKYQAAYGLLYGQLTIESLEHIGVFKPTADRVVSAPKIEKSSTNQLQKTELTGVELAKNNEVTHEKQQERLQENVQENVGEVAITQDEVKFVPLLIEPVNKEFDAKTFVPHNSKPEVYAYIGTFKLWRCAARSVIPERSESGDITYGSYKEFRATLCKMNRSQKLITRLQTALRDQGYLKPLSVGEKVLIDGVWGVNTLDAVKAYQQANGLAYGQLTIETLEHLGVFIKK